jgi:hypothetical protein
MEEFDLAKSLDNLIKPTDPPSGAILTTTTEVPTQAVPTNTTEAADRADPHKHDRSAPTSIPLESILSRLSPEGQAWLNGLNRFCRSAVECDLRSPNLFVRHWESLRGTLQRLERDFGPSDNWK